MNISVCIPTYNFGLFIEETLESVLSQADANAQVIVLDSNSSDDTPAVVSRLQNKYPSLFYVRAEERGGIDRDMAKVVSLASGDYCWLLSADDTMRPGALKRVQSLLETYNSDVLVCAHSNCTRDMELVNEHHPILRGHKISSFELHDLDERLRYFACAISTEAFFSFISGLIVRRSLWETIAVNELFVGSCWAHVARFFELSKNQLLVTHVPEVLINRRGENDSFLSQGLIRRYSLAIDGYRRLGECYFGAESHEAFHIRRVLRWEFTLRCLLGAKALSEAGSDDRDLLDRMMRYLYNDKTAINLAKRVTYTICPSAVYLGARELYRSVKRARQRLRTLTQPTESSTSRM